MTGYIDGSTKKGFWKLTEKGLLASLSDEDIDTILKEGRRKKKTDNYDGEYKDRERELLGDDESLENEIQEVKIKRIKRYKRMVDGLKAKYDSRCQIKECNFTFQKKDGTYYSEAHHLKSLAEGGKQEKSNVVILCANHHRMFHYANIEIGNYSNDERQIEMNGVIYTVVYKK